MSWPSRVIAGLLVSALCAWAACSTTGDARRSDQEATPTTDDGPVWLADLPAATALDGDAAARAKRGRTALAAGDAAAALTAFDAALQAAPRAAILHIERGMALLAAGRPSDALDALEKAGAAKGMDALRRDLVRVHAVVDLGRAAEVMPLSRGLAEQYPNVLDAHYAMGRTYLAVGKALTAMQAFDEVRRADPDHKPSQLGALAAMSARPDQDYRALEAQLLRRWPEDPDLHVVIGTALEVRGRDIEASDAYERALALSPDHPTANFNLARLTEERQGLEAARPYYERFLKSAPGARSRRVEQLRRRLSATPKATGTTVP